jgi:hypothetical protein
MTAPATTMVSAEQRDAVLRLSVARFRPDEEVHRLEQECFFAHPRTVVAARFRSEFLTLLPPNLQRTLPVSSGSLAVGSRLIATPLYLTRPQVAVEIAAFDDERVAYVYLDGSPFRGGNTIQFRDERGGSVASVTLRYQVVGLTTAIGWYLLGGARFHRRLIAEGFRTLERLLSSEQKGAADVRDVQQR